MRKKIFLITLAIFAVAYIFFQTQTALRKELMQYLTRDILYLKNGDMIVGWIWDEKNGVIVGETIGKELFAVRLQECGAIERKKSLMDLRQYF